MTFSQSLWHDKIAWNRERLATVSTVMTKFFLSLNLLGRYYDEVSHERHKSMTLKSGCVTSQRFSCSVTSSIELSKGILSPSASYCGVSLDH
jgi:hypothetical protein